MTSYEELNEICDNYCEDVLEGKIIAPKYIIKAIERNLYWGFRDDIYFDADDVGKKIRFVAKMKHCTSGHNNKPFLLLPYQKWMVANLFGWKYKHNNKRVTTKAILFMARKSGKTAFASALALMHTLIDGEPTAEVDIVANGRSQAHIALDACVNYSKSIDPNGKLYKRYRDEIRVPPTNSKIQIMSSDSMTGDGYNSSMVIFDEIHAQRNYDLYNVMMSSTGMRNQPLFIMITTAGFLLNGYPLYEMRQNGIDVLEGNKTEDSTFFAFYELDDKSEIEDENMWIKANPSLGHTVSVSYLKEQVVSATNNPSLLTGILTKNFNLFCQTKDMWFGDNDLTNTFQKINLDDYKGEHIYIGVDLSAVADLTAFSICIPPNMKRKVNPDKYVIFNFIYVPESTFEESINAELYKQWWREGYVKRTSGNVVDYDAILTDILTLRKQGFIIRGVYYDAFNATQFAINATSAKLPMQPFNQSLVNFNGPTKEFERQIRLGNIIIEYNPCVRWQFNNVVLKRDYNENMKPDKALPENKIDNIISMVESLGGFMVNPQYNVTIATLESIKNNK